MEIRVLNVSDTKLIGRKHVRFQVERQSQPTPSMWETRNALAAVGGFKVEGVAIVTIRDKSGSALSEGEAHVYQTKEELEKWEPKYIVIANMEPSARKSALGELKKKRTEAKAAKTGVKK